ncbi:MAG: alpha/beta hydrolase [Chitinophagales bacterium]
MKKHLFFLALLLLDYTLGNTTQAQTTSKVEACFSPYQEHTIASQHLNEERNYWVSLPMRYDTSKTYPVLYVLDAEWRFGLIQSITYDLAGNKKIPGHIIVGIPHVDWEKQRGIDLTFSQSRMEYDGEIVDSTSYNASNSGGAAPYYRYLTEELLPDVNQHYATNGENILIGHSYGGYFGSYILSMQHPFSALQIYDPSIWYSNGEVLEQVKKGIPKKDKVSVFITYQPKPRFHANKIKALIRLLKKQDNINLQYQFYRNETHNALYMYSFLEGMHRLYGIDYPH